MALTSLIVGIVLIVYLVIPPIIGILAQMKARAQDKKAYGTFPGVSLFFHVIISVMFIVAAFTWMFPFAIVAGSLYVIKVFYMLVFQQEMKAFRNMRTTQETNSFLQNLRMKCPQSWIDVECYHMVTHVYRDSNGHRRTKQQKVVTFRQRYFIRITAYYDRTPPLYGRNAKSLIYL